MGRRAGQPLSGVTRMPFDGALGPDIDTAEVLATMLDEPSSGIEPPAAIHPSSRQVLVEVVASRS